MSEQNNGLKKIEDAVVGTYKKIEDGVVGTYKKIEDTVVDGYKEVEAGFVGVAQAINEQAGKKLTEMFGGEAEGEQPGVLQKIEDGVVGAYKKIEDTVVDGYKEVEEGFVGVAQAINEQAGKKLTEMFGGETNDKQ